MTPLPSSTFRVEVRSHHTSQHTSQHTDSITVQKSALYFIQGDLTSAEIERLCRELLSDPVTESYTIGDSESEGTPYVEVTLLPGVTDTAAENLIRAAHRIGLTAIRNAATGQRYTLGNIPSNTPGQQDNSQGQSDIPPDTDLHKLAVGVFSNPVIQRYTVNQPITPPFVAVRPANSDVEIIPVQQADDNALLAISRERRLALDLNEMRAIRDYYAAERRDPTDAELEMIAQTWSEHCVHKTFKAVIDYDAPLPGQREGRTQQRIDGLLRTYIRAATETINKPWVRSAFVDNAGIIAFDEQYDIAFKVETHNHPSALEPFGGANTGVGGVVRDVLGVSARPIANTDVLCFGMPDAETIPAGVLHPRRIMDGVIAGIEDYGNKMGIPTVNGATLFHPGYTSNPLVFCGCLGILPHGSHVTGAKPGDLIVVLGGRTGRDGLRGATFSSMEMDTTTSEIAGSAVQIGHPIHEKQVLEVVLRARDARLYTAITDCGAGGLSSAVGEMPAELGAQVQLADVPLKYAGLRPWEIWLSEAQERMVLAIPPDNWGAFAAICEGQSIEAVCIGTFEQTGRLVLHYGEKCVGDLDLHFLHDGIPQRHLRAEWSPTPESPKPTITDIHGELLRLLADPNIRSKEKIVRLYDHEVQGGTAIKPLVGNGGHSDAAVIVPLDTVTIGAGEVRGIVLSNGIAPHVADPYDMAFAAIDEAMRNLVAVGGDPDQVAILDNFCWGNPTLPDRLGTLVRCAQGCHDAAIAYGVPFISGKDSLNNEYADENGTRHAIPGTLLISAVSIVPDVNKTVTSNLKRAGNALYVVNGESAPLDTMRALHRAIRAGLVEACHDVSEGGIAVAIAEMCIAGGIGAAIDIEHIGIDSDPFVEGLTRFVVEVAPDNIQAFEAMLPCTRIGVVGGDHLSIGSVQWHIADIDRVWRGEDPRQRNVSVRAQKPFQRPARVHTRTTPPRALILHATGTNRDRDAALACRLAGAEPEIVHVNQLASGERKLGDYQIMIVPGGFSYGDDLGAGKLWALDLINSNTHFGKDVEYFISDGRPVLGICNGFQALVKAGLLPGGEHAAERSVTLTFNKSKHFECRWTFLSVVNSVSLFTDGITDGIYCPVAHGEGRFIANDEETLQSLWDNGMVALTYLDTAYPGNPNGSQHSIAGICNAAGNVLGLMPHPENHIFPWQHPAHDADDSAQTSGLRLFKNAVKYA